MAGVPRKKSTLSNNLAVVGEAMEEEVEALGVVGVVTVEALVVVWAVVALGVEALGVVVWEVEALVEVEEVEALVEGVEEVEALVEVEEVEAEEVEAGVGVALGDMVGEVVALEDMVDMVATVEDMADMAVMVGMVCIPTTTTIITSMAILVMGIR